MIMKFTYPEGATPIDDISHLKPMWVRTQEDLNNVEAENILTGLSGQLVRMALMVDCHWALGLLM